MNVIAQIDKDYIAKGEWPSRVGTYWSTERNKHIELTGDEEKLRFRLKDDDGEVYYGGWLIDDNRGEVQSLVLDWGMHDAGCTVIEVKINDEWEQEIG